MFDLIAFLQKNKRFFRNCSWLYLLQVASYIFPLLVVPYLIRVIGIEKYGMIAVAQSAMQYMVVITDYGFNLTATRRIATLQGDDKGICLEFNNVMFCKLLLMCLALFVYLIFIYTVFQDDTIRLFYLYACLLYTSRCV